MATNYRNYYPVLAVAFAPLGTNFLTQPTGFYAAHGVQSFGSTTNFNLDRVNELGQINVYENIEGIPNVDVTVEKVIDGNYLLQHLASPTPLGASSLNGRYNNSRATVIAAIYNQGQNAASGTPLSVAEMSGMYVSSININIPVDGNMTESVTLVGNNKVWYTGALPTGLYTAATKFNNADSPPGLGGVQRRENVDMTTSLWPRDIPGIDPSSRTNDVLGNGQYAAHIQNIQISVNLNRTELFEQGRRGPYYRFAQFPTDVTCSIEVTANEFGDSKNAYEESTNLSDETIYIALDCGVQIDLGSANKLTSISNGGGDTGGGNQTVTYNYSNQNYLTVTQSGKDFLS